MYSAMPMSAAMAVFPMLSLSYSVSELLWWYSSWTKKPSLTTMVQYRRRAASASSSLADCTAVAA